MAVVADVLARLRADSSDFTRGFAKARAEVVALDRQVKTTSGSTAGGIASMGGSMRMAGVAAAAFGAIAGAALVGVSIKGISAAASMEQTEIAFKTMLGSGEAAAKFLDELQAFAAETPFEFTQLTQSTRKLMAMGFAADEVMPTLTALGDAAAGLGIGGEGIQRITLALGQMKAKGKVSGEELRQLAETGIPALRILADSFGVSTMEMTKMIESGSVMADEAMPLLIKGLADGTKNVKGFGGMMEQQSKTMMGVLSTLKDTISIALIDGFKPALPAITAAMKQLMPAVKNLVEGFGNSMGPMLATLISDVAPAFVTMAGEIAPVLADLIGGIGTILGDVMPLFTTLVTGIGQLVAPLVGTLQPVIAALIPSLRQFVAVLAASLVPIITALQPHLTALAQGVGQILISLLPLLPAMSQLIVSMIPSIPAFTEMGLAVTQLINALMPFVLIVAKAANALIPLMVSVNGMTNPMRQMAAMSKTLAAVLNASFAFIKSAISKVAYVWGASTSLMKTAWTGFGKVISPVAQQISSWMNSAKNAVIAATSAISRAWSATGGKIVRIVSTAFSGIVDSIMNSVSRAFMAAKEFAGKIINGLLSGISAHMPKFAKDFVGWTEYAINAAGTSGAASAAVAGAYVGDEFGMNVVNSAVSQMNQLKGKVEDVFAGNRNAHAREIGKAKAVAAAAKPIGSPAPSDPSNGSPDSLDAQNEKFKNIIKTIGNLVGVMQGVAAGATSLKSFKVSMGDVVKSAQNFKFEGLKGLAALNAAYGTNAKSIRGFIETLTNGAKSLAGAVGGDKLKDLVTLRNGLRSALEGMKDLAERGLRAFDAQTQTLANNLRKSIGTMSFTFNGDTFAGLNDVEQRLKSGLSDLAKSFKNGTGTFFAGLKAARDSYNQVIKDLDARQAAATPAEQRLKDMQEGKATGDLLRRKQEAEDAIAAANKIRNVKKRGEALAAANKMLDDVLYQMQIEQLQKEAEAERAALDEQIGNERTAAEEELARQEEHYQEIYDAQVTALELQAEARRVAAQEALDQQILDLEAQREEDRKHFENQLTQINNFLNGRFKNVKQAQKALTDIFGADGKGWTTLMGNTGKNMGLAFAEGLGKAKTKVEAAIKSVAEIIKQYLKLNSPAKIGPLSTLDDWFKPFSKTLMSGIDKNAFGADFGKMVKQPAIDFGGGYVGRPVGGPVTIQITVEGSVVQERDLAESLREELIKIGRRDGSIFGGIV